ncbi:hypothetical protein [Nonomuraea jabiensis]|uniref:NADH-ubiquinone oxidoreductase 51kDa subunit FMN-binding domain-containing protein n=1 Tax=Nonomuraea jabiensis TaxID=882448 RepID=A0A7W9GF86_9ACTN|nr:hypothetical protein [Nonomuraea jabiensis]
MDLEVEVVAGAGSYVAGEETALIAGLEGGRGCARARPPYPTGQGLWNAPTVVNNVETLAAVPWIVSRGGETYARRSAPRRASACLRGGAHSADRARDPPAAGRPHPDPLPDHPADSVLVTMAPPPPSHRPALAPPVQIPTVIAHVTAALGYVA